MKNRASVLLIVVSGFLLSFDSTGDKNAWKSIFNGKDLKGWKIKITGFPIGENFGNTFRVADGVLSIRYDQYGDNFNNRFGALYFDKKLKNFRLKLEYRFVEETAPGAPVWGFRDSGIQYLGQDPGTVGLNQQFPVCVEFNLHGGNGKVDRPTGELCTPGTLVEIKGKPNENFCTVPEVKRTFHGDQWVTAEILIVDGKITQFANGEEIMHGANARYDPKHDVGKKLLEQNSGVITEGFVSLQSNSHPIDFRNIEIMEN
ncbi:MAG: DUF1080 domain-containing protein [Chryseolinea sp.]